MLRCSWHKNSMIIGFDPSHSAVRRAAERLGRVVFAVFGPVSQGRIQSLDEPEQHQCTAAFSSGFAKNQTGAGRRTLSWRNADNYIESRRSKLRPLTSPAGDWRRRRHGQALLSQARASIQCEEPTDWCPPPSTACTARTYETFL